MKFVYLRAVLVGGTLITTDSASGLRVAEVAAPGAATDEDNAPEQLLGGSDTSVHGNEEERVDIKLIKDFPALEESASSLMKRAREEGNPAIRASRSKMGNRYPQNAEPESQRSIGGLARDLRVQRLEDELYQSIERQQFEKKLIEYQRHPNVENVQRLKDALAQFHRLQEVQNEVDQYRFKDIVDEIGRQHLQPDKQIEKQLMYEHAQYRRQQLENGLAQFPLYRQATKELADYQLQPDYQSAQFLEYTQATFQR